MISSPEVLVVGGGPGGASAAYWLARNGVDTLVVEKKSYPRDKTCGDGLTPRAVRQLIDMGYDFDVPSLHRITGLRAYAGELKIELPWPEHSIYPNWGAVIRRADLDGQVANLAEKQGAIVLQNTEAVAVVADGGVSAVELRKKRPDGTVDTEVVSPRFVIVADGSLSRFGRALGTKRRKDYPYGLAVRGYAASPNSQDPMLESQLNILDGEGRTLPGYGWVFPLGDGTINVGAGLISSFKDFKKVNTSHVLSAYLDRLPGHWQVDESSLITKPVGGKLPMSLSVGPKVGRNWITIGDAAGAVNPFNGEGIDYAYETARMGARFVEQALASGDANDLVGYEAALDEEYRDYNRVARVFAIAVGRPAVMRALTRTGLRSRPLMEWVLKVMANLLEPEDKGVAERVYGAIERIVKLGPDSRLRS
jgi:geranylgeranyl reductase family protein